MQDLDNAGPEKWRTKSQGWKMQDLEDDGPRTSQGVENAGPTKMTEQIAGLTMQDQWLGGKTLYFVANITNILSWN